MMLALNKLECLSLTIFSSFANIWKSGWTLHEGSSILCLILGVLYACGQLHKTFFGVIYAPSGITWV